MIEVPRELHLFVTSRRHLGDGPFKILRHFRANGVELQSHLFDLVFASSAPRGTRRIHSRCCDRCLNKCSAFHDVLSPPRQAERVYKKVMASIRKKGRRSQKSAALLFPVPVRSRTATQTAYAADRGLNLDAGSCWGRLRTPR